MMHRSVVSRFQRLSVAGAFVFALVAVSFLAASPSASDSGKSKIDASKISAQPIWSASFKKLDGEQQVFADWKGKTLLIYFWATWCAPCHKEAPRLSALYEKFKDDGFVVVGLAVDNADKVRKFVEDKALKNPTVYGGSEAIKLGRDLGNDLGAIPYTVIVDNKGNVVETLRGDTPDGKVEGLISNLLG